MCVRRTDNLGDGATITVNGGHTTVSTTGLTQIDTTVLGSPNAHQALLNGQFGLAGTSGQVSSTETETVSKGAGSGTETALPPKATSRVRVF